MVLGKRQTLTGVQMTAEIATLARDFLFACVVVANSGVNELRSSLDADVKWASLLSDQQTIDACKSATGPQKRLATVYFMEACFRYDLVLVQVPSLPPAATLLGRH